MQNIIMNKIKSLGGQGRIVSIGALKTLEKDLQAVKKSEAKSDLIDLIVNDFFSFEIPDTNFPVRAIIVAAMPNPYVLVKFHREGKIYSFPNEDYLEYRKNSGKLESSLNSRLMPHGFHVAQTEQLPMKPLAVRSGLCQYGRNNITYAEGMGSFISLHAFFSDLPSEKDDLYEISRMDSCETCSVCLKSCPTGAIKANRNIIDARECLTYLNEFVDLCDFPEWLSPTAHNSLHGCIICQAVCPKNKLYIQNIQSPIEFDEGETELLLKGATMDTLPRTTGEKIRLLCLEDYLHLLPRNLLVLLEKQAGN